MFAKLSNIGRNMDEVIHYWFLLGWMLVDIILHGYHTSDQ